jgi:predicted transcriptional regulator
MKSTADYIIEILSENWPLTTKQIYNRLKRSYGVSVSYQAVHKQLKKMLEEKMITKNEKTFLLSYTYIKKLSSYSKKLESSLRKESKDGSTVLVLDSLIDCGKFLINEFLSNKGKYPNPENKDSVCMWTHAWPIVGASPEEHETMKKIMKETTHWNVCVHSTFLDKVTSNYVKKLGKKVVLNKKFSMKPDTFVQGDFILQAHFPEDLEKEMHQLYTKIKSERDFDMKKMFDFGSKKYGVKIVIFKNQELADSLREEAKKLYEEK